MFGTGNRSLLRAGLLATSMLCAAPTGRAEERASAAGHVAAWLSAAIAAGEADGSASVPIAVHMALRDASGLKQLVDDVSTPGAERYGRYLSKGEFSARYAPARSDVRKVVAMLRRAGMTDVAEGPDGVYVTATATVDQLRATFAVTQRMYAYKGRMLRSNAEEPSLPKELADKILYVQGLDETASLRHPARHAPMTGALAAPDAAARSGSAAAITPPPVAAQLLSPYCSTYYGDNTALLSTAAGPYGASVPWLNCGYTPQQVRAAYGLDKVKFDGKGVTVAIIDAFASPTLMDDLNRFSARHGLPKVTKQTFRQIIPEGIYDVPAGQIANAYDWYGEQSLDVAAVHGAAPGAKIVFIGSTDNGVSLDVATYNALYNRLADVVTCSFSSNGEAVAPSAVTSYDQALMAAAALGMTVMFSSDDVGDASALNGVASGAWPATSSYATGVGGTSLELKDAKGDKAEYGWGNYRAYLTGVKVNSAASVTTAGLATAVFGTGPGAVTYDAFSYYAGAGGGISLIEPQPAWQAGVVPQALATTVNTASGQTVTLSAPHRVSPDVGLVGDPYTGYLSGETFTIAGDATADEGCTPTGPATEYCESASGGTSLSSPLFAGMVAVWNQKRLADGAPLVGFVNPLLYSLGSGPTLRSAAVNQIKAPTAPQAMLRGYSNDLTRLRLITINSVPLLYLTTPYPIEACDLPICEGVNEVFNYSSEARDEAHGLVTPAGYNDIAGLGAPWVPELIRQ